MQRIKLIKHAPAPAHLLAARNGGLQSSKHQRRRNDDRPNHWKGRSSRTSLSPRTTHKQSFRRQYNRACSIHCHTLQTKSHHKRAADRLVSGDESLRAADARSEQLDRANRTDLDIMQWNHARDPHDATNPTVECLLMASERVVGRPSSERNSEWPFAAKFALHIDSAWL
jgi:hypothetical protein